MSTIPHIVRIVLLAFGMATISASAGAARPNVMAGNVAIEGYDVVAYLTDTAARAGQSRFSASHDGVVYWFASTTNKDRFLSDPERYVPAYDGWCAYGARVGQRTPIDPTLFRVRDGRTFLFLNRAVLDAWMVDEVANARLADSVWPDVGEID